MDKNYNEYLLKEFDELVLKLSKDNLISENDFNMMIYLGEMYRKYSQYLDHTHKELYKLMKIIKD